MSQKKKQAYTEDKIKTLSSLEHIRLRTGMYIGRTGSGAHYDDGIYILVKEVIDNGIDEFIMGHGERINVSIEDDMVTIRDFGRGIPLGKVIDCVSKINTGAKYNDDVFQFSVFQWRRHKGGKCAFDLFSSAHIAKVNLWRLNLRRVTSSEKKKENRRTKWYASLLLTRSIHI